MLNNVDKGYFARSQSLIWDGICALSTLNLMHFHARIQKGLSEGSTFDIF